MASISVSPDKYNYADFVDECKSAYLFYHLRKNNYDVTLTASKIKTCRTLIHKLMTGNKKKSEYNLDMSKSSFCPDFWKKKVKANPKGIKDRGSKKNNYIAK